MPLNADARGIDRRIGLEIVEHAARPPAPRRQHPPVVELPRLPFVDQADDAGLKSASAVALHAADVEVHVTPSARKDLLLPRRLLRSACAALRRGCRRYATTTCRTRQLTWIC